ncbi:hypothetical protein [Clostridium botulinum]|uniref:hypothetical protein n=1 Tax=Clostridium botulinum TaxID=1491 RepID=UPI001C9AA46A|nr:hypothetical protein [Clostridium botulinum]MBY6877955.1 hypothetical protein [Clostridium botulinum]
MMLGNWDILSPHEEAIIWSNNKDELMIELDDKKLAKIKLLPEDVIVVSSYDCMVRIDEKYKSINIMK